MIGKRMLQESWTGLCLLHWVLPNPWETPCLSQGLKKRLVLPRFWETLVKHDTFLLNSPGANLCESFCRSVDCHFLTHDLLNSYLNNTSTFLFIAILHFSYIPYLHNLNNEPVMCLLWFSELLLRSTFSCKTYTIQDFSLKEQVFATDLWVELECSIDQSNFVCTIDKHSLFAFFCLS